MRRALGSIGSACAFLLALWPMPAFAAQAGQAPIAESTITATATIEALDQKTRTITLKRTTGGSIEIKAPDEMQGFNSLRVGDEVTATYFEAAVISLRKPGDPVSPSDPITITQRKDRAPGSVTRREQSLTVSVQAIDAKVPSITVTNPSGKVVTLTVRDPKQLQNLKVGETVDVRYYESLLINVARPPKR